jgi:triacylglycerol lipase
MRGFRRRACAALPSDRKCLQEQQCIEEAPAMIYRLLILAAFCLAAGGAAAQVPPDIAAKNREIGKKIDAAASNAIYGPLQPKAPFDIPGLQVVRDIAYGPGPLEKLDVFTLGAANAAAPKPILIFVHGGAFVGGDKSASTNGVRGPFYDNVMVWAARNGMVGVNINYDLAPKALYPTVQSSISTAIVWVQLSAARFGGDPGRIYIMGHSAGATHIAAYLANPEFFPRGGSGLKGAILSSGPLDAMSAPTNSYFLPADRFGALDFQRGVLESKVPVLVFQAEFDPDYAFNAVERFKKTAADAPNKPIFVLNKDHGHLSESYAIGTSDQSVTGPLLAFIRANP